VLASGGGPSAAYSADGAVAVAALVYSRSAFSKGEEEWGMEGGGRSSGGRPGKARARLRGPPER
jgi:hypothetical protein